MISSILNGFPCGNKVPILSLGKEETTLGLLAQLNSFVFDWVERSRQANATLNWFVVKEQILVARERAGTAHRVCAALSYAHVRFAGQWQTFESRRPWRYLWGVTTHERHRLRAVLEAIVAHLYGLDLVDVREIVKDCDYLIEQLGSKPFTRTLDPKGFWRVEKDKPPELRLAVLAQVAFADLCEKGLDAFLNQNDGEGWMLPESLRLADYNLGHDQRAKEPQPVAAALGERFRPWQLSQTVEESWEECERHAELIRKILRQQDPEQLQEATANADQSGKQMGLF